MKNDRLWKVLAQRDKAYAVHLATRRDFQRKTVEIMQKVTGYKMSDQNAPKPYLCSYTAGHLFYTTVVKQAFGIAKVVDLEKEIMVNTTNGGVTYRGNVLAEAPVKEEETRRKLIRALHKLESAEEIVSVKATYETLKEITTKAMRVVEGIKLLGIIPGQCEICRRLGM